VNRKNNKQRKYKIGDCVKNLRDQEVGILLTKENGHPEYWKVLSSGEVSTWFVHNLSKVSKP
tara:strand:- start:352 stop:537 length:186 start_codon:yes stop_codon:yes gene_type:complete